MQIHGHFEKETTYITNLTDCYTVDCEIFVVKKIFVDDLFGRKLNTRNILRNLILVAKVWRRNLDYAKKLQAKYFTGENIPIYGK